MVDFCVHGNEPLVSTAEGAELLSLLKKKEKKKKTDSYHGVSYGTCSECYAADMETWFPQRET
jgi:hypothetical protein